MVWSHTGDAIVGNSKTNNWYHCQSEQFINLKCKTESTPNIRITRDVYERPIRQMNFWCGQNISWRLILVRKIFILIISQFIKIQDRKKKLKILIIFGPKLVIIVLNSMFLDEIGNKNNEVCTNIKNVAARVGIFQIMIGKLWLDKIR